MSTDTRTTRQFVLASRPNGTPTADNFRLEEVALPALAAGEVLVRNTYLSVDPYMRGRMNDAKSYIPPFGIDEPLTGGAVGEVVESRSADLPVGAHVSHFAGWREAAVLPAAQLERIDTTRIDASAYLSVLGMTGFTAYAGLMKVAEFREGDTVFVSGAAGAVGSIVGQIARLSGAARVVGSAGTAAKIARLHEFGFDAAFDYHGGNLDTKLAEAAPGGIDVYFDNVGGDHLEAALGALTQGGRVAMCGAISQYNATSPAPGPRNLALAIGKCLTLRGFVIGAYEQVRPEFVEKMSRWVTDGDIRWDQTVRDGIDAAPAAFLELFEGGNTGKMLVRL